MHTKASYDTINLRVYCTQRTSTEKIMAAYNVTKIDTLTREVLVQYLQGNLGVLK